jgi:hypothetical protein
MLQRGWFEPPQVESFTIVSSPPIANVLFSWVKKIIENITSNLSMLIWTKHNIIIKLIIKMNYKSQNESIY